MNRNATSHASCSRSFRAIVASLGLLAVACEGPAEPKPEPPRVASIEISSTALSLEVGQSQTLAATLRDQHGAIMTNVAVAWAAADASVAAVASNGVVTAKKAGSTRVSASVAAVSSEATVTVRNPPPPPTLVLSPRTVALAPGDSAVVGATYGIQSTSRAQLTAGTETRWSDATAVLDPVALTRGVIRATGAGYAKVLASAFGAAPDTVTVTVLPGRPYIDRMLVSGPVGTGDTVRLEGFGFDRVHADSIRLHLPGGATTREGVSVLSRDSASLRLRIATLTPAQCMGATAAIAVGGADLKVATNLVRERSGEQTLALGDTLRFKGSGGHCLQLTQPGEYAVVYSDMRLIRRAQTEYEGAWPEGWTVTATDRTQRAAGSAMSAGSTGAAAPRTPSDHREVQHSISTSPGFDRATPWSVGDRFTVTNGEGRTGMATVRSIHGSYLVLATMDTDTANWAGARDANARAVMAYMDSAGMSLIAGALGSTRPITSLGSGQLLVLVSNVTSWNGLTRTSTIGGGRYSVVDVDTDVFEHVGNGLRTTAHELTHAWQSAYSWGVRQTAPLSGASWAVEGGADFIAFEVVRRYLGIPLWSNWEWYPHSITPGSFAAYTALASAPKGDFVTRQYEHAASYMVHLLDRAILAGVRYEDALVEIARGSLEGWNGYDMYGGRRTGLAERMRALLGPSWNPEESVLRWTASTAVDDILTSALYTNRAFRFAGYPEAWGAPSTSSLGWKADASFTAGGTTTRSVARSAGSSGYMRITTPTNTSAVQLSASIPDAEWLVIRYR